VGLVHQIDQASPSNMLSNTDAEPILNSFICFLVIRFILSIVFSCFSSFCSANVLIRRFSIATCWVFQSAVNMQWNLVLLLGYENEQSCSFLFIRVDMFVRDLKFRFQCGYWCYRIVKGS